MDPLVERHYANPAVRAEIAEFCRGRWVSLEGSYGGRRVFVRYFREKPITVSSPDDVSTLLKRYSRLNARTLYATLNVYRDLSSPDLVDLASNIVATTAFWDIDTSLDRWSYAIRAAELIVDFLKEHGISESVYLAWSGEGVHVRLHERSFSMEILGEHHPLDVAYAVVDYVLRNVEERLEALSRESGGVLKVENLVDHKRVFTVPLSLHRKRDLVAVFFDPTDIPLFDISWAQPGSFRHRASWKRCREGEADDLAKIAISSVLRERGSLPSRTLRYRRLMVRAETRENTNGREIRPRERGLGRFQVMGLLQAARYYLLTGDLEKAKSFGLNRAIFYAWAKHYGKGYVPTRAYYSSGAIVREDEKKLVEVAGEEVYTSPRGFFVIGDREQLPGDYDRNIAQKIDLVVPYDVAWEAAVKYLSKFPLEVLRDQRKFYEKAYKPVRDNFVELVVGGLADEERGGDEKGVVEESKRERRVQPKPSGLLRWARKG